MRQATPVPITAEPLVHYDESGGFDGWNGPSEWIQRDDHLLNDGSVESAFILAPDVLLSGAADYAVDVELRVVRCDGSDSYANPHDGGGFGLVARSEQGQGYWAGYSCGSNDGQVGIWALAAPSGELADGWSIDGASYDRLTAVDQVPPMDGEWHRLRIEVEGYDIRLFVDGALAVETTDLRFVEPGAVGLWSSLAQIEVRGFTVLPLS